MKRFTVIALVLFILGFVLIAFSRARTDVWIYEGLQLKYTFPTNILLVEYLNGTSKLLKTDSFPGFEIFVLEKCNNTALVEVRFYYVINNRTYIIVGKVRINVRTREVFLLNGTKVGVTGIWLNPNMLYTGARMIASSYLDRRRAKAILYSVPYVPDRPYGLEKYVSGRLNEEVSYGPLYVCRPDYTDREALSVLRIDFREIYEFVKKGILNGTIEGRQWRVYNITKEENKITFVFEMIEILPSGAALGMRTIVKDPSNWYVSCTLKPGYGVARGYYQAYTGIVVKYHFDVEPLLASLKIKAIRGDGYLIKANSAGNMSLIKTVFAYNEIISILLMMPLIAKGIFTGWRDSTK